MPRVLFMTVRYKIKTLSKFKAQLLKRVECEKYILDLENNYDTLTKKWQLLYVKLAPTMK